MKNKSLPVYILSLLIFLSFIIKLVLIFRYRNLLTLDSDDLNYIKSAVVLVEKGVFVFHNYNEPTVFVMPLYPAFLAGIFKLFGYGLTGLQAVRIVQAVLSSVTIVLVFMIARQLFNYTTALVSSFLVAFYPPNIVTAGYLLTETLFTALLALIVYLSLIFSKRPTYPKFILLGLLWAASTLCRPTIAFYPVMLLLYILFYYRINLKRMIKLGFTMAVAFVVIMAPWWIRNYQEYGDFIPLTASSGNPMLQGTYVDYKQTPENVVHYKLGENAYETNKIEVEIAKKRIKAELKKDFWGYIRWYTIGKTYLFWGTVFYWKEFFGIKQQAVMVFHYFILSGFIGIGILAFNNFYKYMLPVLIIVYFNAIHCFYMAFDRYAFPVIPLLSIFSAFLSVTLYRYSVRLYKLLKVPIYGK